MKDDLLDFVLNMLSIKSNDFLESTQIHIRKAKETKETTEKKTQNSYLTSYWWLFFLNYKTQQI